MSKYCEARAFDGMCKLHHIPVEKCWETKDEPSKPDNNTALKNDIANAMYSTDYKHVCEEPDYFDKNAVDVVVALFQEHSTARVVAFAERLKRYDWQLEDSINANDVAAQTIDDELRVELESNIKESSLTKKAES